MAIAYAAVDPDLGTRMGEVLEGMAEAMVRS
jgi:hypothetical protein